MVILGAVMAAASEPGRLKPDKQEKCPVCGMFVYKYPDWTAQIVFNDKSQFYFDGVKDLFKFVLHLDKYHPGRSAADIASIRVTDYYDVVAIDGRSAHYVVGSDVTGPMGRELIPFASGQAALEFSKDHGGTAVLTYEQITPAVIDRLD
jgi:nitrous oxide reductase accessory protein NosL